MARASGSAWTASPVGKYFLADLSVQGRQSLCPTLQPIKIVAYCRSLLCGAPVDSLRLSTAIAASLRSSLWTSLLSSPVGFGGRGRSSGTETLADAPLDFLCVTTMRVTSLRSTYL